MARTKGAISKPRQIDAEELREVLKPVFEKLKKAGVPEERLPTLEAVVSHVLDWVDDAKVDEWVKKYAALEGR